MAAALAAARLDARSGDVGAERLEAAGQRVQLGQRLVLDAEMLLWADWRQKLSRK